MWTETRSHALHSSPARHAIRYNVYITSPAWRRLADRVLRAVIFITHHTRRPSERLILLSSIDNIDPGIDLIAITEPATSYNLIAKR